MSEADSINEGVYIYPDWKSCISGTWRQHVLHDGAFCNVTGVDVDADGILTISTQEDPNSPRLKYSPPNYHSFGVPPTQKDPFETNTVEVKLYILTLSG